ncbi:MAG: glycosyltransferase family 2 protein [Candidatus Eiseniibacteriota bacterium]|nr:MAG: glycosyltransferase family 2 protein [Candidatus Eisenbacteria bacterium]
MKENVRILVVIPAYNEAANVGRVVAEVKNEAHFVDALVIDDGSIDDTAGVAARAGAMVVRLPFNLGMFEAVRAGFAFAHRSGYDITVQVDADGQHVPREIAELVRPVAEEEYDVVVGSRYLEDRGYKTPLLRKCGIRFFAWLTSLVLGQTITDTTCGFRAYGRRAFGMFASYDAAEFKDSVGLVILGRAGLRIKEIPVTVRERIGGRSTISALKALVYPFEFVLSLVAVLARKRLTVPGGEAC